MIEGIRKGKDMSIIVIGKNAVRETVASNSALSLKIDPKHQADPIVRSAVAKKIPVEFLNREELTRIAKDPSHQGFLAICQEPKIYALNELLDSLSGKPDPLLLILDSIEDPHNLGAILRSCDAFGVDGVIMKKRGEAPFNSTVAKVSTGAFAYVKLCQVANLSSAIRSLKDEGYWIASSDGSATASYEDIDYNGKMALVVGSEGFGISHLVLENSDFVVKIPMVGHVNSLNASVATGIFLAMAAHKRGK